VIALAVDAVGVGSKRIHAVTAVESERERREILSVTTAQATAFPQHDACLAA
jgi:hypothetical protein